MDNGLDYVAIASTISWTLISFCFFLMFLGAILGSLMIVWGLVQKQKFKLDWTGLLGCTAFMFVYFVLPLGLQLPEQRLDVRRHGFFSWTDLYTWVVFVFVILMMTVWSTYRVVKMRKQNFGVSILLFALLILASGMVGQIASSQYGGAWTS